MEALEKFERITKKFLNFLPQFTKILKEIHRISTKMLKKGYGNPGNF